MLNGILRSFGTRLAALACIGLFAAGVASTVGHSATPHTQATIAVRSGDTAPAGVFGWD